MSAQRKIARAQRRAQQRAARPRPTTPLLRPEAVAGYRMPSGVILRDQMDRAMSRLQPDDQELVARGLQPEAPEELRREAERVILEALAGLQVDPPRIAPAEG